MGEANMQYLNLPVKYEGRVRLCYDVLTKLIPASDIYLFGNYARGNLELGNMIHLLVLIGEEHSNREIHRLHLEVEEMIYRINDEVFQVELIILSEALYTKYLLTSKKLKQIELEKRNLGQVTWR